MPTTLPLKNIPDAVYERLKLAAEMHKRSLNSEAIMCLESVLMPTKLMPNERIARAREMRATLSAGQFHAHDIDLAKRRGRPCGPVPIIRPGSALPPRGVATQNIFFRDVSIFDRLKRHSHSI